MSKAEIKEIIINNQMTYRKFASYFNISIDDAIKVFRKLDLKRCSKGENCVNFDGPVQSRSNFHNSKEQRDGLASGCIYCVKQKSQTHYQNNKEHCKQMQQKYRQNNAEHCKQRQQRYYQNNKKHHNQLMNQHHQNNKRYFNQLARRYHYNNKEYFNQKRKEYISSFAKFDTYNIRISYAEKTRRDPNDLEMLQVRCTYCNSWFNPINKQVRARIDALEGKYSLGSENRFYCCQECKESCPIYHQKDYSKDDPRRFDKLGTSREIQTELRQLVFERDNWTCQRCGIHKNNLQAGISLHCHHIEGVRHEPIESADMDMCMTVCSECHKEIHRIPGCTYQDMQCRVEASDELSSRD